MSQPWSSITQESQNVWCNAHCSRVRFLVDAENYFAFLYHALRKAQKSIALAGWDMHSDLQLIRPSTQENTPTRLMPLLESLAAKNKNLQVYALNWDFAMIFLFERQILPIYHFEWSTNKNIHFRLDDAHPLGGSQHQKIVVIDRKIAFVGGIDLGTDRWDTRRHWAFDKERFTPDENTYPPFHDMQVAVEGDIAEQISVLMEERWRQATRKKIRLNQAETSPWPEEHDFSKSILDQTLQNHANFEMDHCQKLSEPHLKNITAALSRTLPAYKNLKETREIESLHLAAIANAKNFIYIENQYLTSHSIGQALTQKLEKDRNVQIVIVTPLELAGWLEESSMGVLRSHVLYNMRQSSGKDQFRILYPVSRNENHKNILVNVHAKIIIVDDMFLHIGSANLSNRSMGLDSEIGVTIFSDQEDETHQAIKNLRHSLLAEHFDETIQFVQTRERKSVTGPYPMLKFMDQLCAKANQSKSLSRRSLVPLQDKFTQVKEFIEPMISLADPERSIQPEKFIQKMYGKLRDRSFQF